MDTVNECCMHCSHDEDYVHVSGCLVCGWEYCDETDLERLLERTARMFRVGGMGE